MLETQPSTLTPKSEALRRPEEILTGILLLRKKKNSAYTKSALARDMGISQPLLSLILNKQRALTTSQAKRASILLKLSPGEERELVESTLTHSKKNIKLQSLLDSHRLKELDFDQFSTLAQWHHMPILALTTTRGFKNDPQWIAKKIGVTPEEAKEALERLIRLGLLTVDQVGRLRPSKDRIDLAPKKTEAAIRAHHTQMMKRAEETMRTQTDLESWAKRDISSLSIAVDPSKILEAKQLIQKFREDIASLMTEGNIQEVYQLNVQLFPLTRIES